MTPTDEFKAALSDLIAASRRFGKAVSISNAELSKDTLTKKSVRRLPRELGQLIVGLVDDDNLADIRHALEQIKYSFREYSNRQNRRERKKDAIYLAIANARRHFFERVASATLIKCSADDTTHQMLAKGVSVETVQALDNAESCSFAYLFCDLIWRSSAYRDSLNPGGKLYESISRDAGKLAEKRKRKRIAAFRKRFGMTPAEFLPKARKDSSVKIRRGRVAEPVEATRIMAKGNDIEAMKVEAGDFREALRDKISERLESPFK